MLRNPIFSTIIVTISMLLYQVFSLLDRAKIFTSFLLLISPLLMVWLVITILKDKKVKMHELKEDEEWGYSDKEKDSLGIF